jgi:hypothetical protein
MSTRLARGAAGALWLALVLCAGPTRAAPPDALDELLHSLAARHHAHVAFTEVQYRSLLSRPRESSGELLFDAPDRLEKRILEPKPETLVLAHGVLTATRGRHTRTLELAAWPQLAPLLESLRATLAGDRGALERVFSVRFDGDTQRWTLHLAPRDRGAARLVKEVTITGEHANFRTVEILEADGDHSLTTIGRELKP